ncbi:hypothetical protein GF348_09305 [candidate division KSB3 bacterium]|nr:hypothetical protein [candidate division KSB3 bacterium]
MSDEIIISSKQYREMCDLVTSIKQRARLNNDAILLMMAERLDVMLTSGEVFIDFTEEKNAEI